MGGGIWGLCVFHVVGILTTLCSGAPADDACAPARCSTDGPVIRFPFRSKDQPIHCGYRGFELSCRGNETVVELPFSGRFSVRSISYDKQRLHLDPRSCPLLTFLKLNLSTSPLELHEGMAPYQPGYLLLNCTSAAPSNFVRYYNTAGCLGAAGRRVFGVPSTDLDNLDETCVSMRTELVPQEFVAGLCSGDAYDPTLLWGTPDCQNCEAGGGLCGFRNTSSQELACIPRTRSSGRWTTSRIIGVSVGAFVFLLILAAVAKVYLLWKRNRDQEAENRKKIDEFLEEYKSLNPMRYSYADIKKMTDQFKTKLGDGGYGVVYKGLLPGGGIPVAVKVLTRTTGKNNDGEEFVNEVRTIGRIHHVNVVRLLGFCADGIRRALIYDFMPNETLAKFILEPNQKENGGRRPLTLGWAKLHEIAVGIARGIEYLHQGCDQRILHFDIKPHNILLDHNLHPKISDFGLAKLCSKEQSAVSVTAARGTVGYIAPELASRGVGNVSYKSDVYSFGMLLLEMVGGRKNAEWIYHRMHQGLELTDLMNVAGEEDGEVARTLAITALWCIQWFPVNRPSMKSVVQMLEGGAESLVMPPNPFVSSVSDSDPTIKDMNMAAIPEAEMEETVELLVTT